MTKAYTLTSDLESAVKAIRTFRAALKTSSALQERLPNARTWFALQEGGAGSSPQPGGSATAT